MNGQSNQNLPDSNSGPDATTNLPKKTRTILPSTAIGWWALGVSAAGMASWVVLPVITTTFRDVYPITDTWVMPATGVALIDAAAILNVLALWRWRERSLPNIVAAILAIPMALFFTFMVVGEGLAGA